MTTSPVSFSGFAGGSGLPPFLVGSLTLELGAILFVKRPDGWRGFALDEGASAYGVYVAPAQRSAVIFTMLSREGPGQDYTSYRSANGLQSGVCSTLVSPRGVPFHLYMDIKDFNIDAKGQGAVIGAVEFDGPKAKTIWYRSRTKDWGGHWSRPIPIPPNQRLWPASSSVLPMKVSTSS